jgi:DNA-binding NarL/FixJ family response regulator
METIRILLVDGNAFFRRGVRTVLEAEPELDVVGEASIGREALDQVGALSPDVVICDAKLGDMAGLEFTRRARLSLPSIAVVLLTATDDEDLLFQAIRSGVAAYFTKDVDPSELMTAIRRVRVGEYLINESVLTRPNVASHVLDQFRQMTVVDQSNEQLFAPLSARETEILDYIAHGNSNKEIARALHISDQTVKNHITSILRKLAVNDRTQAVVFAVRHGLIQIN